MKKTLVVLTSLIIVLAFSVSITYAALFYWSNDADTVVVESRSMINDFFAYGTGAENDPYGINEPNHLFNLAWLQYMGKFQDAKYYFEIDETLSPKTLDLGGMAVPPIGTDANPFLGAFNGNGCTIKNLFVSTLPNELRSEFVLGENPFVPGNSVGFFGTTGAKEIAGELIRGRIENFYLENLLVSTNQPAATVGLICGLVGGAVNNIGVSNSKIKLGSGVNGPMIGGTQASVSDFSLIGRKGEGIIWVNEPGSGAGGSLIVNPMSDGIPNGFPTGDNSYLAVPGAIIDRAFYIGALSNPNNINTPNRVSTYPVNTTGGANSKVEVTINSVTNVGSYSYNGTTYTVDDEFAAAWNKGHASGKVLAGTPTATAVTNVTLLDHTIITVPNNSIYFNPLAKGRGAIMFSCQSNQETCSMGLYRFQRNANGSINTSTFSEYKTFVMRNTSNGEAFYFEFELEAADVGYEYVLGASARRGGTGPEVIGYTGDLSSKVAAFFYLKLPGVDLSAGDDSLKINYIDYVRLMAGSFPDLMAEGYKLHNTKLMVTGGATAVVILNYNEWDDSFVYYCSMTGGGVIGDPTNGITVAEAVTKGTIDSKWANNVTYFPTFPYPYPNTA